MGFESISLLRFRNLRERTVSCEAPEVFLIGRNGQGKTNFIEAVYLLCFGSSFRTHVHTRLVQHGSQEAAVRGVLTPQDEPRLKISVQLGATKEIKVDGAVIRDRKRLLRNAPCIVFCHEDMEFVKGSPGRRRRFFDQTLSLTDLLYVDLSRTYRRALRGRNALLRQGRLDLLEPYDYELARWGCEIRDRRQRIMESFSKMFAGLYARVSGQEVTLSLRYAPSWGLETQPEEVMRLLAGKRANDVRASLTTTGPHRDRYMFEAGGRDFAHIGSTGQMRMCSLVLRCAQAEYFARSTGRKPVLLLDDVILELDAHRKIAFMQALPEFDQAFFTFLPEEGYEEFRSERTLLLDVSDGDIRPWNERARY